MKQAFIGVDVGTSSARAGVFDESGMLLATARHPITIWHEAGNVVEQSSSDIWAACVASVRAAMAEAALPASAVKGIGFDATCSLVVLDAGGNPRGWSLDAVIGAVAHQMGERIAHEFEDLAVELGFGAVHFKLDVLVEIGAEVAHDARQFLPRIADRLHARLHHPFLKLGGDVRQPL